jgi:two-component system NtrC family sensor kinase
MKKSRYADLRRDMILLTLIISFTPLIILGAMIYQQFARVLEDKTRSQLDQLVRTQRDAVEVFLRERGFILSTIVDTHRFEELNEQEKLTDIFQSINRRSDGLGIVDLGIIDNNGDHLAYAGPYNLQGLNYAQQHWFKQTMSKGKHISDVFMGFRQVPHFIIAVRGQSGSRSWILRATVDSDIFNSLVRSAQTGKRGDAFIINKEGVYQTDPRTEGVILGKSSLELSRLTSSDTLFFKEDVAGKSRYHAGAWLKNNEWFLVVSKEEQEAFGGLVASRNREIMILIIGCVAIFTATVLTTEKLIRRLEEADLKMSHLNAQLVQTDKLAALGKMAAGIAHEINNPLAVIGEKAGWMRDLLQEEGFQQSENLDQYTKSLDKIEEHVERARKITHNMLGFARRMEPRLDDVDINAVLNQTVELLANHARLNNIAIQKNFQNDIPVIASDQSQLQQVFLNLINNAVDAIGRDGQITLSTRNTGNFVEIDIQDNGPGIPKQLQPKVFDPFFTTKPAGSGTGLGLSISFNIIQQLNGQIDLVSAPQTGTTFTIRLPLVTPGKK